MVYTPFNVSKKHQKAVENTCTIPTNCRYCNGNVVPTLNEVIYGKCYGEYPWIYMCVNCKSFVGIHKFTNVPLGTLANNDLRNSRKTCKPPFLELAKIIGIGKAYKELAIHLNITQDACHFGMFEANQCELAKNWALSKLQSI